MKKLFLICLSLISLNANTYGSSEFDNIPTLATKGEISIFKPSDQMEASLGVVTVHENSSESLNENNRRMQSVISSLQGLGLDDTDYKTGRFYIRPIYKHAKDTQEEDHLIITHYEVTNTIQIKTTKIAISDKILSVAVQNGANQIDQVNFNLSNPQAYREEAIKLATQNALADASVLANAAGVKIVRIIKLSLDQWHTFPNPIMLSRGQGTLSTFVEESSMLEPGQTEIHAVVYVTMQIGSS